MTGTVRGAETDSSFVQVERHFLQVETFTDSTIHTKPYTSMPFGTSVGPGYP